MTDTEIQSLGERMKQHEEKFEMKISNKNCFVVRLDGKNFSKFTGSFKKPFDENFVKAMYNATLDTFKKFYARVGYCHSDEASFYFSAVYDPNVEKCHFYNGRVLKICTVMAGYFSTRFAYHIDNIISEPYKKFIPYHLLQNTTFDARLLEFEDEIEAVNHMIWRSCYDCHRNCVATYAQSNFSSKQLHGKNTSKMIEMLKTKGIEYDDIPFHLKYGIYFKNEQYLYEGGPEPASRTRIAARTFNVLQLDDRVKLMTEKYWNDEGSKLEL